MSKTFKTVRDQSNKIPMAERNFFVVKEAGDLEMHLTRFLKAKDYTRVLKDMYDKRGNRMIHLYNDNTDDAGNVLKSDKVATIITHDPMLEDAIVRLAATFYCPVRVK